jgi:hypothetical protein
MKSKKLLVVLIALIESGILLFFSKINSDTWVWFAFPVVMSYLGVDQFEKYIGRKNGGNSGSISKS